MALFHTILVLILVPGLSYIYPNLLPKVLYNIPCVCRSNVYSGHHGERCERNKVITSELSAYIEETMGVFNITGLSLAIVPKDGDPELKAWGYRSEDEEKMTSDTLFHMASVSKAFCATALGILMDDFANRRNVTVLPPKLMEITWHTKVKDLLPDDWELMDEWASEQANLKDILAHVSGVPRHDFAYGPHDTPLDLVKRLKYLRPAFELREQWSYNNIMFVVVAHIISTYANQPYTRFVQERIFVPLDMSSTTFSPRTAAKSGKFTQGWTKAGRLVPEWFTEEAAFTLAGPGGIISNAIDMSKWISTWLNAGTYNGTAVIPLSVYWNTTLSYTVSQDHPEDTSQSIGGCGLGWFRRSYRGHDGIGHLGSIPGVTTLVSFLPSDKFGIMVFANGGDQEAQVRRISNIIIEKVLCLVDSQPLENRLPSDSSKPKMSEITSITWSLPLSPNDLSGTYTNPGYGTLTFCGPNSTSFYCSKVHANFTTVDEARDNVNHSIELLAAWPRFWSSHVRMRYLGGTLFSVHMTSLFPNGYGKDSTPFEIAEIGMSPITAEFVIDEGKVSGFGMTTLTESRTGRRARLDRTVKDSAEVWFDRI